MKKTTSHGLTIHLVKKLPGRSNPENPLSINAATRKLSVNEAIWRKTPKPIQYWLMVWARHRVGNKPLVADALATLTYCSRGYSRRALARWFVDMLRHKPSQENMRRVREMSAQLRTGRTKS